MTEKTSDLELFQVYSISYEKAHAEIRGNFTFFPEQTEVFSQKLLASKWGNAFLISTCNRTEIYMFSPQPESIISLFCETVGVEEASFYKFAVPYKGEQALTHLFRVSSGLDSQILGDFEIISQLKKWIKKFKKHQTTNYFLEKAVNTALQISKKVKSETLLSNGTASVSFAAVNYLIQSSLPIRSIALVGTGKIGQNTCENLLKHFPNVAITVLNRTPEKAEKLAAKFHIQHKNFEELSTQISQSDALIVSTNAPQPIIDISTINPTQPLVILDLSVPHNVAVALKNHPNIQLLNVDDLSKTVDETLESRKKEIPKAEAIIESYIHEFLEWNESRKYAPMIRKFKENLDFLNEHNAKNLQKNQVKINGTETLLAEQLAQKMTNRLADYILENPEQAEEISKIISTVFQLERK